jgi:hypothetical protein
MNPFPPLSVFSHRLFPSLENPSAARNGSVGISRKQEAGSRKQEAGSEEAS